jgi:hypothetical protein
MNTWNSDQKHLFGCKANIEPLGFLRGVLFHYSFTLLFAGLTVVYELVQEITSDQADKLKEACEEKIDLIQGKTAHADDEQKQSIEWFLMAMFLVSQAAMQKRLAETIIDRYFQEEMPQKGKNN